jgi:predicted nucleotide-binding protein
MAVNLTGTWTGEMAGTNFGGMTLEVHHDDDRIYGVGRFYEPTLGSYAYDIQGTVKGSEIELFLGPKSNQGYTLGNVQAICRIVDNNTLSGHWKSTINTEGVVTLKRFESGTQEAEELQPKSVFVIHGHDEGTKEKVARFLEKVGLSVVILHEQVNRGLTILEKFERFAANAGFAVALFTPDDIGYPMASEKNKQPRARQNVVLELGYFIGKLGRDKVFILHKGSVELPSDIFGVVYAPVDESNGWQLTLARELRAAGYDIDLNKIVA